MLSMNKNWNKNHQFLFITSSQLMAQGLCQEQIGHYKFNKWLKYWVSYQKISKIEHQLMFLLTIPISIAQSNTLPKYIQNQYHSQAEQATKKQSELLKVGFKSFKKQAWTWIFIFFTFQTDTAFILNNKLKIC